MWQRLQLLVISFSRRWLNIPVTAPALPYCDGTSQSQFVAVVSHDRTTRLTVNSGNGSLRDGHGSLDALWPAGSVENRWTSPQEFAGFFSPDDLDAMTVAYKAALSQLWIMGLAIKPHRVVVKKKLAQIILASACRGERKPDRLKDIALRALSATAFR
jgi:hypothetical protein